MNLFNTAISLIVSGVAFAGISAVLSNTMITVKRFDIKDDRLPENMRELKILHLSDLHRKKFGKDYKELFERIPKENYDMVCFTGDLMSRTETDFTQKAVFIKKLVRIAPVYFVMGNHEADNMESYEKLKDLLLNCGVCVLDNRRTEFTKNGQSITISGFALGKDFYRNRDGSFSPLPRPDLKNITDMLGEKPQGFEILLSHNPLYAAAYKSYGAELVLSGHIHGGAIRLPFVGGVLSPERKFFPEYSAGLYKLGNTNMIVSKGLGKLRLFNCSEIAVVTVSNNQDKSERTKP